MVGWLGGLSVTLCSLALGEATDRGSTVFERGQMAYEDPTIKIQLFHHRSQECPLWIQNYTYELEGLIIQIQS